MIDLHSHILPGLDDGAQSLSQALRMARIAAESGITAIAVTPHCATDRALEVTDAWRLLRSALAQERIPVKLLRGMEIFGTPDTLPLLQQGRLFTLNSSQYPLIEFPFQSDGQLETQILSGLLEAGYRPLVAHPERYEYIQNSPQRVNQWYRMGCLFQINRGSLLGRFGSAAQEAAFSLVDRGFATVVASDAHSPEVRTPYMADVYEMLAQEFSPLVPRILLQANPRRILQNKQLPPVEPEWF